MKIVTGKGSNEHNISLGRTSNFDSLIKTSSSIHCASIQHDQYTSVLLYERGIFGMILE